MLYLTEDHEMIRENVREFVDERVAPIARDIDKSCEFPMDTIKAMGLTMELARRRDPGLLTQEAAVQ